MSTAPCGTPAAAAAPAAPPASPPTGATASAPAAAATPAPAASSSAEWSRASNGSAGGGRAAPPAGSANATPGACDGPPTAERLLSELHEYHVGICKERVEFRRQRAELSARLVWLENELQSEDAIGRDLVRRIETLEAAIRRERRQYEALVDRSGTVDSVGAAGCSTVEGDASELNAQAPADLFAAYVDRLPKARKQSCREHLRARLLEAGILDTFATGADDGRTTGELPRGVSGTSLEETLAAYVDGDPALSLGLPMAAIDPGTSGAGGAFQLGDGGQPDLKGAKFPSRGQRWTLRSHLDGARCVVGDDANGILISCGEDALVKCWDLNPLWRGASNNVDEIEPYATLRGHTSAVVALAYRQHDRVLFSAGMDLCIRAWRLPDWQTHDLYGTNLIVQQLASRAGMLVGHSDAIWDLQHHPHLPYIASASADGTVGIWAVELERLSRETGSMETCLALNHPDPEASGAASRAASADATGGGGGAAVVACDSPSTVAWVPCNPVGILAGFVSSRVAVFDVNRGAQVLDMLPVDVPSKYGAAYGSGPNGFGRAAVTSSCCHQVMNLSVTGHVDGCARLADLSSGRFIASFADHPDAVTSVCLDPTRSHRLVTGCHDGCVRSFDLRVNGQRCLERLRLHQAKYDEALHCVYHGSTFMATAGADGNVGVLLLAE